MDFLPIQFQDYQDSTRKLVNDIPVLVQDYTTGFDDITREKTLDAVKQLEWLRNRIAERQNTDSLYTPLSREMPLRAPILYDIYQPAVATLEAQVSSGLYAYAVEQVRLEAGLYVLQHVERQPAVRLVTDSLLLPWPHDLQEWGRQEDRGKVPRKEQDDKKEPTIKLDEKRAIVDLRTAIVNAMYQKLRLPTPKGLPPSPEDVINERKEAASAAEAEVLRLLKVKFPSALGVMLDASAREDNVILPSYTEQLFPLMADLPAIYLAQVQNAKSLDELKSQYAELMGMRLAQIGQVFESYRHAAPIIPAKEDIPNVPTTRDYSLLYQTTEGVAFINLYDASRRVLPTDVIRENKFLDEIPRNLIVGTLAPSWPAQRPHPMDRVTTYFIDNFESGDTLNTAYSNLHARDALLPRGRR